MRTPAATAGAGRSPSSSVRMVLVHSSDMALKRLTSEVRWKRCEYLRMAWLERRLIRRSRSARSSIGWAGERPREEHVVLHLELAESGLQPVQLGVDESFGVVRRHRSQAVSVRLECAATALSPWLEYGAPLAAMQTQKDTDDRDFRRIPAVARASRPPGHGERDRPGRRRARHALIREDLRRASGPSWPAGRFPPGTFRPGGAGGDRRAASSAAAERLLAPAPRRVINATGVDRAHEPRAGGALRGRGGGAWREAAAGYLDLEYDLARGARGRRMAHLAPLLAAPVSRAASALVVNNNAAAVLLALRALARRARGDRLARRAGRDRRRRSASRRSWPHPARGCARWGRRTARAWRTTRRPSTAQDGGAAQGPPQQLPIVGFTEAVGGGRAGGARARRGRAARSSTGAAAISWISRPWASGTSGRWARSSSKARTS